MSRIDPIEQGLKQGWHHIRGSQLQQDTVLEADVVIIGSGAGGGTAAEILSAAGLTVIMVEAGPLKSSRDFDMEERHAYPNLYQQAGALQTKDKAISIFQGRAVGGSTTINWTTSIRTPVQTLEYWRAEKSVQGISETSLQPWFEQMEQRLSIRPWTLAPNANNRVLAQGCETLGWDVTPIRRNVTSCWNTGYCGMGCPVDAKQSMLITTIPAMLSRGGTLLSQVKAVQIEHHRRTVYGIRAEALSDGLIPTGINVLLKARHYILAGGAIHTPALMLRSWLPDPYGILGRGTFLHPSVLSGALFDDNINAHSGAPQSIYSDQFLWRDGVSGELGYKLEVPPVHPVLLASKTVGYGRSHAALMQQMNHLQVTIALMRDGFSADAPGGSVILQPNGRIVLDYPLTEAFWQAARHALLRMAELQFAAGARQVLPIAEGGGYYASWREAKQEISQLGLAPLKTVVASAHVMGGCPMGEDRQQAMVSSHGRSHYLDNLSVFDGSVFPTSLGANPQLSIYGLCARNATLLADSLIKPTG